MVTGHKMGHFCILGLRVVVQLLDHRGFTIRGGCAPAAVDDAAAAVQ